MTADKRSTVAEVRLRNTTGATATFTVQVGFAHNGKQYGTAVGTFAALPTGQSRTIPVISVASRAQLSDITCHVGQTALEH